ncbi:hypothetical protein ACTXT7_017322 [Hymenolepis weldensis]
MALNNEMNCEFASATIKRSSGQESRGPDCEDETLECQTKIIHGVTKFKSGQMINPIQIGSAAFAINDLRFQIQELKTLLDQVGYNHN